LEVAVIPAKAEIQKKTKKVISFYSPFGEREWFREAPKGPLRGETEGFSI
jgi:hypothetical protein